MTPPVLLRDVAGVLAELGGQRGQPRRIERRQLRAQRRQQGEAVAQRRQVARPRRAQRDAREDAFEVAEPAEGLAQRLVRARVQQRADGVMALAEHAPVAQRAVQPAPQQAAAHRADARVEDAEQRVLDASVDAAVEFEMPARRGVQRDAVVGRLERDRGQVRQALLLRLLDVGEQRAGGGDGQRLVLEAEAAEVVQAEEPEQLAPRAVRIEQPGRATPHAVARGHRIRPTAFVGHEHFGRIEAREFGFERVVAVHLVDEEPAAGEIRPCEAVAPAFR